MTKTKARPSAIRRLILASAWLLVLGGVALLAWRLPRLPATIPLYRSLVTGAPLRLGAKSALALLRVPLIGAAQLLAVGALAQAAERAGAAGWRRFWLGMAATIGLKAALESLDFARLGAGSGPPLLLWLTILLVLGFAAWALSRYVRGQLRGRPPLDRAAVLGLALGGAAWLLLASWPLWRSRI